MTYAFVLDASACSGCKACQVACKDKNQLPLGVLWRRVYEVSGGSWQQAGAAWTSTVFAYNLSLSCNHCIHPKCAGVCPADAYTVRDNGIVLLDISKCMGCGYCAWACPYEAPQYDQAAGHMTKCNFCYDNLEQGLPPACVSACPLRALDCVEVTQGEALPGAAVALWEVPATAHPYPMRANSRTQPRLAIKPHAAMSSEETKRLANREEIHPRAETAWREAPLVAFTLLAQTAVGAMWAMLWLARGVQFLPMLVIGLCLGASLLASFAHLGTKSNAWRALSHLRKSWLSREILFTILFGVAWFATLASMPLHAAAWLPALLAALLGYELVYCMSRVYRLSTVPAWNSWRTNARFFLSAALLGPLVLAPLLAWMQAPVAWSAVGVFLIALLMINVALETGQPLAPGRLGLQYGLFLADMLGCALVFIVPGSLSVFSTLAVLLLVLAGQIMSRWSFYIARINTARTGRLPS